MSSVRLRENKFRNLLHSHAKVKHSLVTTPNIVNCNCEQFELEKYSLLPYDSTKPVYYYLDNRPTTKIDTALSLVTDKCRLNFRLTVLNCRYKAAKKRKHNKLAIAAGYEPSILAQIIKVMNGDPDEYFQGSYNWYYTGGCMDVVDMDGDQYIFHVSGENMSVLNVSRYNGTNQNTSLELTIDEAVLEVVCENQHLILRSKSSIFLYKFNRPSMELNLVLSCQGAAPFICARLRDQSTLVCLDLDHILRVVPLADRHGKEREMSLAEHFKDEKEKWASFVLLSDERLCLVVTRAKLILVDIILMKCTGSVDIRRLDVLRKCNHISGVWRSKFVETETNTGDLIYLSLTHDIVAMRLHTKQIKGKNKKNGVPFKECIRWAHQLKSPPMLLKTVLLDDFTELLYISSLVNNSTRVLSVDRRVCVQGDSDDEGEESFIGLHSYYPPFKPLGIMTSFDWCHRQGELIETKYNFRTRIHMSTIGLGIVQDDGDGGRSVKLLTMNSMGDIYHQTLRPKGTPVIMTQKDDKNFLEEMRRARNSLVDQENLNNVLTVTGCHNLKELFLDAIFHDPVEGDDMDVETPAERHEQIKRKMRRAKWNRPVGKLKKYRDVLSQDLLAVWDVSDEEDNAVAGEDDGDEDNAGNLSRFMEPSHKVSAWLATHDSTEVAPAPDNGDNLDYDVETSRYEENRETMQEIEERLSDSQMFMDTSLGPDVSTQQKRRAKKKSRVSGF